MHKNILNFLLSATLLLSFNSIATSQELAYKAGYYGFFHNQEYFNPYIIPQTMGGSRIYGQLGFQLNENQSFYGGANYLYEFGAEPGDQKISPIMYYQFLHKNLDVYLGSFPRYDIINMPELLLIDTLKYYRPNVEGIFLKGKQEWGYQNAWLDWTSRQTDTRRETFSLGLSGQFNMGSFFYRHHFIMFHYAGPAVRIPDDHIRDNGGGLLGLGVDLSHDYFLDSLSVYTAYALSYDQYRGVYETRFYHGLLIELNLLYKFIGIKNTFYTGDGQIQLLGDKFYTSKTYNRTDLYLKLFKQDWIKGYVEFGFHYVPGILDVHQKFTIRVDIGGKMKATPLKNTSNPNP